MFLDKGNGKEKRQRCNACGSSTNWLKFEDVQGRYTNKLEPGLFQDIYWTSWPLPAETPGLFYLDLKKNQTQRGEKRSGEASSGDNNLTVTKKSKRQM